jgi:hypothetical protein
MAATLPHDWVVLRWRPSALEKSSFREGWMSRKKRLGLGGTSAGGGVEVLLVR